MLTLDHQQRPLAPVPPRNPVAPPQLPAGRQSLTNSAQPGSPCPPGDVKATSLNSTSLRKASTSSSS